MRAVQLISIYFVSVAQPQGASAVGASGGGIVPLQTTGFRGTNANLDRGKGRLGGMHSPHPSNSSSFPLSVEDCTDCAAICRMTMVRAADWGVISPMLIKSVVYASWSSVWMYMCSSQQFTAGSLDTEQSVLLKKKKKLTPFWSFMAHLLNLILWMGIKQLSEFELSGHLFKETLWYLWGSPHQYSWL